MTGNIVIATFYHFAPFHDYKEKQPKWLKFCKDKDLKGTILVASEGINSTISGTRENIDALLSMIKSDERFSDMGWKESYADFQPFERMKVRLKEEIVRLGVKDLDIAKKGEYISAEEWDGFISRDDVITIDTRNDYEVKIGTFDGAVNPNTKNFREFPRWFDDNFKHLNKKQKIAMFCTGGIRCEKSTSYLKNLGFDNVYHLEGGILKYLEETNNKNKKWLGECFVFDDRVAVSDNLDPTGAIPCEDCGATVTTDDLRLSPPDQVLCQNCIEK